MAVIQNNVLKGDEAVLLVRNDADTLWEVVGGVKTRGLSTENPVEDTTSSSTPGDYAENEFTGYSSDTISISGVVDTRTGQTKNVGGTDYTVAAVSRMDELAHKDNRAGKFKLIYTYKTVESTYQITAYNDSGDTPGLLTFDATLQTKESPTVIYL
jgi:predicted secreted protein